MKKFNYLFLGLLLISQHIVAQVPSYVPTDGLVGYWPFNGNANDESENGNNGVVYGATLSEDRNGYDNSAYNFQVADWDSGNNGGDYIYIPHSSEFNFESFSLSAWVYRTSDGASNSPQHLTILRKFEEGYNNPNGESWQFDIAHGTDNGGSILKGTILQQSPSPAINFNCATAQTINENEWTNVIMTYANKTIKTFINGVESCSLTNDNITLNTLGTSGISIGMSVQANGNWGPFDGSIDEVGIWDRVFTEQEIADLYNSNLSADNIETSKFAIYPNPTSNTLFISGNETPIAVAIYNVLGKEVLSVKNINNINVEALPSGVYVIRISDGVGQTNRKFIKN